MNLALAAMLVYFRDNKDKARESTVEYLNCLSDFDNLYKKTHPPKHVKLDIGIDRLKRPLLYYCRHVFSKVMLD